jgi:murein DD-endopeptidase MepM/ murein hydrolase activator NlpD
MKKQARAWDNTPSITPVALPNPRVTSGFGWRKDPITGRREFHAGVDIPGPPGTGILAPAGGVVLKKGHDKWLGRFLVLQHDEDTKTVYGHLKTVLVDRGSVVARGQTLGFMGNTGMSTSHHLHYSVIVNQRAVDPAQYMLDMGG